MKRVVADITKESGVKFLLGGVALMWVIGIAQLILRLPMDSLAIYPRSLNHLASIFTAPFVHWGLFHLISNTLPILILGFLIHQLKALGVVTLIVTVITGILVWLFARDAHHAGASGVVMGYFSFILSFGFFHRSFKSIFLGFIVFIFYGGLMFTLLDMRPHISFESHVFGFISGVIAAWWLAKVRKSKE